MAGTNPPHRRKRDKLNFDPTISLGHILSTLAMILALAVGWSNLNSRISVIESGVHRNESDLIEMRKQIRADYRDIISRLTAIQQAR